MAIFVFCAINITRLSLFDPSASGEEFLSVEQVPPFHYLLAALCVLHDRCITYRVLRANFTTVCFINDSGLKLYMGLVNCKVHLLLAVQLQPSAHAPDQIGNRTLRFGPEMTLGPWK